MTRKNIETQRLALAITEPIANKLTEAERTALAWTIAKHLALKGVTPPGKFGTAPLIDRPRPPT
jgi:hypothetical protein